MTFHVKFIRDTLIRPVLPGDELAVSRVAYLTGYFGSSAAQYFPAERLFGRLWVTPYLRGVRPPCGFVAEVDGNIWGYIIGTPVWKAYRRSLWRTVPGTILTTREPWRVLWPSVRFLLRAGRHALPHADPHLYPAHLHLNVLAQARGHHLGERLLDAYLQHMRQLGVSGVQLSTTSENVAALRLYRKKGFQVLVQRRSPLWRPWLRRDTEQVLLGCRL